MRRRRWQRGPRGAQELIAYYVAKGVSPELAQAVAEQVSAHDAIAAQLESDHGILEVITTTDAIVAGVGASVAYLIGAAIPLLITVLLRSPSRPGPSSRRSPYRCS